MFKINVKTNVKQFSKNLTDFEKKQIPYATRLCVTALARRVKEGETLALPKTFDRPTPFTMRAISVIPAVKSRPFATVFVKDIQASYLLPYEVGGKQVPKTASGAMLAPKNIKLNQYGNIPRFTTRNLKKKPNYFIGTVKSKTHGSISGVWQRPRNRKTGHLKLLIRFDNPLPVKIHMNYRKLAEQIVQKSFDVEMSNAFKKAMATAKP